MNPTTVYQSRFLGLSRSFGAGILRLHRVAAHFQPAAVFARSAQVMEIGFRKVQIDRSGDSKNVFDAYVIGKEGDPAIVVLQEWWGVDFEIKNHATSISQHGFLALIPDLYRGKLGLDAAEAQHLMQNLDWPGAVEDIAASVKWLKDHGSPKVGVTGFCMGGALALASSVRVHGVDAVAAFYGTPPAQLADVSQAKVPVQAHFGELDSHEGFSDVGAAKALEEKLEKASVTYEVYMYPGSGHAFMNTSDEGHARNKLLNFRQENPQTVVLAWQRFHAWFNKYLKH